MKNKNYKNIRRAMAYLTKANWIVTEYPDVSIALEDVIRLCNEASKIFTEKDYPIEYSEIMNRMGMTYRRLSVIRNNPKYLEESISYYWRSLKIDSVSEYDKASTCTNIAIAYRMLTLYEEDPSYLKKSIELLNKSLEIRAQEKYPYEYAMSTYEMGLALLFEYDFMGDLEKLMSAIAHISKASGVFMDYLAKGDEDSPSSPSQDYAFSNYFLGKAHTRLSEVEDREKNLNKSVEIFSKSLQYLSKDEYSENYGDAAFELGNALLDLYTMNGSKESLLQIIEYYEDSRSIFTLEKEPLRYASITDEMGKAYLYLAKETRLDSHIKNSMSLFNESYTILSELDNPSKEEVLKNYHEAKAYYKNYFQGEGLIYI